MNIFKARNLAGIAVLIITAVAGPAVGESVNAVVNAVDAGSVMAIMAAVGGLLIRTADFIKTKKLDAE